MDGNRLEFLFKMPLDIDLKRLLCHTPAPLSRGIYSGPHKAKIEKDFSKLLNEVLNEIVGPKGEKRLQYFDKVVLADVPK